MTQQNSQMGKSSEVRLREFDAFAAISNEAEKRLFKDCELLRFDIGRPLAEETLLPSHTFWILQGECRLLGPEMGEITTLAKMGPGSCVGVASILRAMPCEIVTAATEVLAFSIPNETIIELYQTEETFRQWCKQTLWPAEVVSIIIKQLEQSAKEKATLIGCLKKALVNAKLLGYEEARIALNKSNHDKSSRVFIASSNSNQPIGTELDCESEIHEARPPFELRLISIPADAFSETEDENRDISNNKSSIAARTASEILQRAGSNFGQIERTEDFKIVRGEGELEEVLACFQMISKELKLPFRKDSIEKVLRDSLRRGQSPSIQLCGQLGAALGLHVVNAKAPAHMGTLLQVPCMITWKGRFGVTIRSDINGMTIASPKKGIINISAENLEKEFPNGIDVLVMERAINTPEKRFGPEWFMPAIERHKGVLIQVLVASFVVQMFSLANPLLIQVIIDKVISQRSLDTLQVLGIGLVIVTILEGVLGSLRTFLFTETTNRIDQRLGAEVIDHLLRLPLNYFDKRPVGELGTRIAELEKIRNFLTGTALTSILDAAFSLIYIVVMALYSWLLTIVALAVLPIQVALTLLGAPLFRRQFRQSAEENAKTQSHLVEVLTGIQTVKAQNVEIVSRWRWQELYARYISKTFEKTITGTALNETSQVLQKLSQLLVLWVGAALVLKGELSLGQLIAFRIISGYVTQPLLRLSSIWQTIQELKVSFERLGDVIDTPVESNEYDQAKIPLPPIKGKVCFEDISFAFKQNQAPVLRKINIAVESGTFVGIVGQSGSGKSTLMKLLPRLYSPNRGKVRIDGYDVDKVELYSLRRQIGIVPQDPLLFSGTVSENIALTNPDASSDEIVRAAKLACAHEFIMELPMGYSTKVGERGGTLSGGQRQRVAIARTLLSNPKLLVMDEATSALDYETERRVCNNLVDNLSDCTVFFITHRLSTIRRADRVIMMHQGAVVEEGSHASLMDARGRYFALYQQQEAN